MPRDVLSLPVPPADRRIAYSGDSASQFIDFRFPRQTPAAGLAVYIHGGFWRSRMDLTHAGLLCAAITAAGFITANVEYRRAGEPGGGWSGTWQDILSAIAFASAGDNYGASDAFTAGHGPLVLGHSAGGHLALLAGARLPTRLSGVIALAPVVPLVSAWRRNLGDGAVADFLGGTPDELPDIYAQACPSRQPLALPSVIIHGTADDVVPIDLSREFVASHAAAGDRLRLIEISGGDHFDVIDTRSSAWPAVLDEVVKQAIS